MGLATVAVLGDLVDPFGAIALGGPIGEPADVVGAVLERRVESRQPPLDRRQLGARDPLQRSRSARRSRPARPAGSVVRRALVVLAEGQDHQRRLDSERLRESWCPARHGAAPRIAGLRCRRCGSARWWHGTPRRRPRPPRGRPPRRPGSSGPVAPARRPGVAGRTRRGRATNAAGVVRQPVPDPASSVDGSRRADRQCHGLPVARLDHRGLRSRVR